jgi:hypothetical protein
LSNASTLQTRPSATQAPVEMAAAPAAARKGNRTRGTGQSISGGVNIALTDTRSGFNPLTRGNLGPDGTYVINPRISATLGQNRSEISDPTVNTGEQSLGSHVKLLVENAQTTREPSDGDFQQIRFSARYHLKNRDSWQTPNMSLNLRAANTQTLRGSVNASAPLRVAGVGVEGGAELGSENTSERSAELAVEEFNFGQTTEYFDHWHDVVIVLNSSGHVTVGVTQSQGREDRHGLTSDHVFVTRTSNGELYDQDTGQKDHVAPIDPVRVNMPLLR